MSRPRTPPTKAANDTVMRLLIPPSHGPIPIPGAFGPRNRPPRAGAATAAPVAAASLHDRAQDEHELEGGGDRRYRQSDARRSLVGRVFDRFFRSKS
jgi:hypothetical protein